ncbi:hypothetical protein B0H17DRAFT_1300716 [Mycena rosella]|uniref:DUF6589 domain-containing protein n=1 Tax=Mycena rosella TaxID=1033263 RepID=A0AAD7GG98_MYCRO|nr:hypothetical protein B0H17DRAFT_1300716 [Mycena rosella]
MSTEENESKQPRLRKAKLTAEQKLHKKFRAMEKLLKEYPFRNLGEFLAILFHNPIRGEPDPRGTKHSRVVARFLRGRTNIKMTEILPLIYSHKASYPASRSADVHEQKEMFATTRPADQIHHARPFISTWATRLVAFEGRKQVGHSARNDPDDPERRDNLRAQTNGRKEGVEVVSWPAVLSHFNLRHIGTQYCIRLPLVWFCTEVWSAPMAKGVFFVRKRRPHPIIQVGAIASFILSRNRYANGDLTMVFGLWHFACKSHVNVKRVFRRFGYGVSDSTARNALNTMTDASLHELREKIKDATSRGQTENALLFDNVQEYCDVYEQGIGRLSELKVGTAGTNLDLDDCAPGAFDAEPYYNKVAQQERKTLTTDSLFDDINWPHLRIAIPLHWTQTLVEFTIDFHPHMLKDVIAMFREEPLALHRMRKGRKTGCQPLKTNGERSTSLQGFERAVDDFDTQRGIDSRDPGNLLSWIRGDGAPYANALRLTTLCTPQGTFKNKIATPEIWHTGATDLNSTAANHYGPATSLDPSSLSKASNIAGLKRPSNTKSCDYYPTVRNLTLIWKAHVLDCWWYALYSRRVVFFETDDLHAYFRNLASTNQLPPLEELLGYAMVLVDRYATQSAIQASLLASESLDPARRNKVPAGSDWEAPTHTNLADSSNDDEDLPDLVDIAEPEPRANPVPPKSDDAPKFHEEKEGFTGDRVLRNSQIFLQDFGWWIEFSKAVPEGDIGRVWEIMKLWIFKFAGSSHQNYVNYLLEVYCMLRYEASKDLKNAILNNWLLNIKGELGKWLPADLHQEHYNKWLEDMIQKHGGEFDSKFYRQTISPNVHHFLQIKEEVETAFELEPRGKTHTSPGVQSELHLLLTVFKEEEVHVFRSRRSMGHAAVNQFARGWRRLEEGKMEDFLTKSTVLGDSLAQIRSRDTATTKIIMKHVTIPQHRVPSSDCSRGSAESAGSYRSLISESIDPNEPEDDGEDLSNSKLRNLCEIGILSGSDESDSIEMSSAALFSSERSETSSIFRFRALF